MKCWGSYKFSAFFYLIGALEWQWTFLNSKRLEKFNKNPFFQKNVQKWCVMNLEEAQRILKGMKGPSLQGMKLLLFSPSSDSKY